MKYRHRTLISFRIVLPFLLLVAVLGLSIAFPFLTERVAAAGYTVNALTDTGTGSGTTGDLRYAITQVNAGAGTGDTITITATGTITLTSALPALAKPVAITGPTSGAGVTVDGNHAVGVFSVNNGVAASIANLTITNGRLSSGNGGGISNAGTLTVTNSTLSVNTAFIGSGGGITNTGTLTVTNSTLSLNSALNGSGGGIYNSGTLTVTNSTFSGNDAGGGGGIYNSGTATVTNSTFSNNSAGGSGGGINNAGTITMTNTIVAYNSTSGTARDINGAVASHGHNLIGDPSGGSGFVASDLLNSNPRLGLLANNGGPTQTFALLTASPATGAGDPTVCASTTVPAGAPVGGKDQRGLSRPPTTCAIGAFEPQRTTYTVGSNSDTGAAGTLAQCLDPNNTACRLRDAIGFATSDVDIIVFNGTGRGTITVGSTLTLVASVTITGPTSGASVTVDGNHAVRVFMVNLGVTVSISDLTIANGTAATGGGGGIGNNGTLTVMNSILSGNRANDAGGIGNSGTLTVTNSILSGNSASNSAYGGGGIDNYGTATVTNSTLSGNSTSGGGGGIDNGGTLTVTNSTLSGNSTSQFGGGIFNGGTLTVTNSTLSGNSAPNGGGIYNSFGTTKPTNTIIAGNTATGTGPDIKGTVASQGHNLIGNTSGGTGFVASDLSNVAPSLDTLKDNGGTTPLPDGSHVKTFALLAGSPAISAGDSAVCNSTTTPPGAPVGVKDQRGLPRPTTTCAIGAFEPQGGATGPPGPPNPLPSGKPTGPLSGAPNLAPAPKTGGPVSGGSPNLLPQARP